MELMEKEKTGFKKTEIGLIADDWSIKIVNDLIDLLTDYDANGSFSSVAENVKVYDYQQYAWYVRSTDLENKTSAANVRYVDQASYKFLKKTSLYGGELLFLKRGDIGNIYLFEAKTKYATLAPNLYLLKLNQYSDPKYLYYYFTSRAGQSQLKSKNASSTLGALYKDDVKSILVPLPPTLKEQKTIATALSDTDALIIGLEKLIAKKKAIKQGAMQQLLTPPSKGGKRLPGFSGEWKYESIKNFASISTGGSDTQDRVDEGRYPFYVRSQKIERINKYSFDGEAILTSGDGVGVGKIFHYCSGKFDFHQRVYCIHNFHETVDGKYFYNQFSIHFYDRVMSMTAKSSVDSVRREMISEMLIHLPPTIAEQKAITKVLSDMDKEIEAMELKKSKYEQLKQGMMQELLTGKTRLV